MRNLVIVAAALSFLGACSSGGHNPAFLSVVVEPSAGSCESGRLCVEVRAEVDGTREGQGSCELFGPGDPDDLDPLASNPDLPMKPGETANWSVTVSADEYDVSDLNPVCSPMAEG